MQQEYKRISDAQINSIEVRLRKTKELIAHRKQLPVEPERHARSETNPDGARTSRAVTVFW
jgi:hypothetical protein